MPTSPQTIASLIKFFDPSVNPRYTQSIRKVYKTRDSWFGKETAVYEVAWFENIGLNAPIADPINFTLHKSLSPCFWITDDKKLLKCYDQKLAPISPDRIYHTSLDALYLGLTGNFARIDEKFESHCRDAVASHIDSLIKQVQEKKPIELRRQTIHSLAEMNATSTEYREARRILINQMLS